MCNKNINCHIFSHLEQSVLGKNMPWVLEGEEVVTWVEKNEAGNLKKMMSEVGDWGHIGLAGYVTSLALTLK